MTHDGDDKTLASTKFPDSNKYQCLVGVTDGKENRLSTEVCVITTPSSRIHYPGRTSTRERQKNAPVQGQGIVEARGVAEEVPGERGGEEEERSYCCIGVTLQSCLLSPL